MSAPFLMARSPQTYLDGLLIRLSRFVIYTGNVSIRPRLFGIPAAEAPVVAVLRRGPSDWFQLGKWSIDKMTYEPGAWLHGRVYPQRCDLSPDGRYFVYLAFKPDSTWAVGSTYNAVSKLPWLHALAAWATVGTWSSGDVFHYAIDRVDTGAGRRFGEESSVRPGRIERR